MCSALLFLSFFLFFATWEYLGYMIDWYSLWMIQTKPTTHIGCPIIFSTWLDHSNYYMLCYRLGRQGKYCLLAFRNTFLKRKKIEWGADSLERYFNKFTTRNMINQTGIKLVPFCLTLASICFLVQVISKGPCHLGEIF